MSKITTFYAIHKGLKPGIYSNWDDCKKYTTGFAGAKYKKFTDQNIAKYFVENGTDHVNNIKTDQVITQKYFFKQYVPNLEEQTVEQHNLADSDLENSYIFSPKKNKNTCIIPIYTDGSCINNGKTNAFGGIGVYFGKDDLRNISEPFNNKVTNQRAELYAVIRALQVVESDIKANKKIIVYTDSDYLIKCMTKYVKAWVKNGWKKKDGIEISNKEYICTLYNLIKDAPNISFNHVRSHTGKTDIHSLGNNEADILAVAGSKRTF